MAVYYVHDTGLESHVHVNEGAAQPPSQYGVAAILSAYNAVTSSKGLTPNQLLEDFSAFSALGAAAAPKSQSNGAGAMRVGTKAWIAVAAKYMRVRGLDVPGSPGPGPADLMSYFASRQLLLALETPCHVLLFKLGGHYGVVTRCRFDASYINKGDTASPAFLWAGPADTWINYKATCPLN